MLQIFKKDLHTKIYEDQSRLTSQDRERKIRLNPLEDVKKAIDKNSAPLIILKPLVETQHSNKLLDFFPDSRALWLYRDYRDVAFSNISHFGIRNGINNLRSIIKNSPDDWRSENVPENVRNLITHHFSEDMNPYDAAALFWYVRNTFFFEFNLHCNPRVIMCRYEDLVTEPSVVMEGIYDFLGRPFPGETIVEEVHSGALGKGGDIRLSPEIAKRCGELQVKLDDIYQEQKLSYSE